jgi:hypothetical protein
MIWVVSSVHVETTIFRPQTNITKVLQWYLDGLLARPENALNARERHVTRSFKGPATSIHFRSSLASDGSPVRAFTVSHSHVSTIPRPYPTITRYMTP